MDRISSRIAQVIFIYFYINIFEFSYVRIVYLCKNRIRAMILLLESCDHIYQPVVLNKFTLSVGIDVQQIEATVAHSPQSD